MLESITGTRLHRRSVPSHARLDDVASSFDTAVADGSYVFEPLARWARETPNKAALLGAAGQVTYRELEARSNQVARALRARGVRRGDLVALVMPRGIETVVAIVGALKAGAAYVPLDPETPAERVRLCIEDAAPRLIVAREPLPAGDPARPVVLARDLFREARSLAPDAPAREDVGLQGADLAYVIFTSGTTGRPKGVPISHQSLTNFARGCQRAYVCATPEDRMLQAFSPASDGHHEELWPTFLAGATLVVATTDDVHSGHDLGAFLIEHRVTIVSCAPTLLSMVEEDVPTLRRILFGAERCPPELVRRWWKPGREIVNTYGPTEATVGATYAPCLPGQPITIGRALPNYYCYIVDENLRQVQSGHEGELCIAGIGVSQGYLGNAALTAQKFVPNPFAEPGLHNRVLYRTGDRARMSLDGDIEWLGRIDSQVKIRGYRIELSDIETHLIQDPAVRSAVAIVRGADTPSPELAALLVAKSGMAIDPSACLGRLRDELPAYMLPHSLEEVDALPVLPSGKVDRKACQTLEGRRLEARREIVAPATETERALLRAFEETFPGLSVSCTDDFFTDLGGYSLLAARLMSLLRNEYGFDSASVRDLYQHSTIRALGALLDGRTPRAANAAPAVPKFAPVPQARYVACTFAQGLAILLLFGIKASFWLSPVLTAAWCAQQGMGPIPAIGVALVVHAVSVPITLLLAVALKWLVVGRFKPGSYPAWGGYFFRWWLAQRLTEIAPKDYIVGTPLASLYLRMLGARVGHNVAFESMDIDCPDLVSVGNDCVIESFAWVRAAEVAHGLLTIAPIEIGAGCTLGVRSGVVGGTKLGNGVFLADLSCVREGAVVPDGEEWEGSPARRREKPEAPAYDPAKQPPAARRIGFGLAQCLMVMALPFIDMIPFSALTLAFYRSTNSAASYLAAPLFSISIVLAVCAQLLIVKWVVLGRMRPGVYASPSLFTLRKWFVDRLLDLHKDTIMPIYDTLYTRGWCLALGMKCGAWTEVALPARMPYDLVELGDDSFIASDVSIGMPMRRNGLVELEKTVTATRVFLGNNSVIPQGCDIPRDSLIGALSVSPSNEEMGTEPDQSWMGSPAFRMPRREHFEQFASEQTYRPSRKLYRERLARESFRILMPSLMALLVAVMLINEFTFVWRHSSLWIALLSTPLLYLPAVAVGIGSIYVMKKLLVGTYKPTVQPLWSRYVWNAETFSMFFHDFGAALFVSSFIGTPFMAAFLRLMGAKVGRRAFIDTSDLTEFDLIEIGEDTAVNFSAPLQCHLFEDRVMKVGKLTIGDRCAIGTFSVVLFDSVVKDDARVGPISLVMKGETIPAGSYWEGSPAQAREETALPALETEHEPALACLQVAQA